MATTPAKKTAAKRAAKQPTPGKFPAASTTAAKYDVHGIILDLGESLPAPERRKILAQLRAIGVNYGQGYLIGKPRPLAELAGRSSLEGY